MVLDKLLKKSVFSICTFIFLFLKFELFFSLHRARDQKAALNWPSIGVHSRAPRFPPVQLSSHRAGALYHQVVKAPHKGGHQMAK